ncbi:MAG: hypothetical protein JWL69_3257, partial [Phycisphaerales bacterium]|nr:hypothetical protein [Phycisphaerales bacterium]
MLNEYNQREYLSMKPMDLLIPPTWRAIRVRLRGACVLSTLAALSLLAMAALIRADAPAGHAGAKLVIAPQSITLHGPGEQHGLLVTLVEADGRTIDVTAKCRFSSGDAGKIAVSSDGQCRAAADGNSDITVDYEGLTARIGVVASDTSKTAPPSFKQDVVPLLTRAGCNAGSCHGKLAGQNGFKLSLRGYAPEWDYESLTADLASRRIDFADAEQSLLVRKALGRVPHEGGRRLFEGSRGHRLLVDWINSRAPGPDPTEADAASLEVLPDSRTMRLSDTQQLLARAHYADGRVRDVTWLCQIVSNDSSIVSVTEGGLVKALRHGAASVRVHFQGLVAVVTFTTPYENHVDPSLFAQKNNGIDEHVFAKLAALNLPPSAGCDDATFVRRAFLDTIGVLPSPREVRDFLTDPRSDKHAKLIDDLLQRPEFADYWALQLGDLLQNRRERDHDVRGPKAVRALHGWLREQMAANRPWDQLARDVLTATGDAVHEPQIGYFVVNLGEKNNVEESDITDSVAQAFLGTRIGCARCHNHPLERYTQDDYYHFAAFFSHVSLNRVDVGKGTTALSPCNHDEFEARKRLAETEKSMREAQAAMAAKGDEEAAKKAQSKLEELDRRESELCEELERARVKPLGVGQPRTGKFMTPLPLDRSATQIAPGTDGRMALAAWMTDPKNEYFRGAMVNRLWKHFMGVGIVEPVDDLRSSNPPSNPALFKALSQEFVSHGYDLKHVMRLILNSRAYQLASTTLPENEADRHFFSHYYARRLPAEEMLDAVSSATGVADEFPGYPVGIRAVQLPEPGVN